MSNINFIKSSFWSLLSSNEIEKVTIPIIQRAYTQGGRKGDKKIERKGERFLERLILALKGNPITLDFVYGSKDDNNKLYPLDGQQRLTTLFLLHWYIAQKENKLTVEVIEVLKKFSYETRQSSRYFCEHLSEYKIDKRKKLLSDTIKNQKWFMLSWEADSTIGSMLSMLDKIDNILLKENEEFWNNLTQNVEKSPIIFFYTSLDELNLTDDLYIKMNARGLELTDFERLKASFEQKIDDNEWEKEKRIEDSFAHKIDTVWADLFWNFRDENNKIDDNLIYFIASTAINFYAQNLEIIEDKDDEEKIRKELSEKGKNKTVTGDAVKRERIERRIKYLFNNQDEVTPDDFPTKEAFNYLVKCLDKYAEKIDDVFPNAELKPFVNLWKYCSDTLFKDIIRDKESEWKNRVMAYAQTVYLLNKDISDENSFADWMRVIRNIVENSTIDGASSFIGVIGLIEELSKGCCNIYDYLANEDIQSGFAHEQVKEEIKKSKIIVKNSEIKSILAELEDSDFCSGSINWCLKCINIKDVAELSKLKNIKKIIAEHFNNGNEISNLFRRALLTVGDNEFYEYWKSWSYGTDTHKRCLIESRNDLKWSFIKGDKFDSYFKPLILQLITKDMQSIVDDYVCPDNMPNWKKRLIKEANLLDKYCEGHYFGLTDDKCYLYYWRKRPANRSECKLVK